MQNKKYTFLDLAKEILLQANKPMTPKEIWNLGKKMGLAQKINSVGKTPELTLGARLYTDAGSSFERVGENPTRFILKGQMVEEPGFPKACYDFEPPGTKKEEPKDKKGKNNCEERKLHPLAVKFINSEFLAYSKTIYHEHSTKDSENKTWLHPDIVAVAYTFANLREQKTKELSDLLGVFHAKLYSFELKQELKGNTLSFKKEFFQAVSNSSWAHEGYLVAPEIASSPEDLMEMERLSATHGIGIIKLNKTDPQKSEILYPARQKDNLDLLTIDKLAHANDDFKAFITEVLTSTREKRVCNEQFYDNLD